jgi:TonB family protein
MIRRPQSIFFLSLIVLPAVLVLAQEKDRPQQWIEVRSAHFGVISNADGPDAVRVAGQFEKMRAVFQKIFPDSNFEPGAPIIVLALRSRRDFESVEPASYLAKDQVDLGGLFMRAPDVNYILLRLDDASPHPFGGIYHEYTHMLWGHAADWLPLWLNEGTAEFYQNTEIYSDEVRLGRIDTTDLHPLYINPPLPLETLFAVDHNSPYYHQKEQGSMFYAESLALTHYLTMEDRRRGTNRIGDYLKLVSQKADPVAAATSAFGDLKQLETELDTYVRSRKFSYFTMSPPAVIDYAPFQKRPITAAQADAIRANVLAYNGRAGDASALLDRVLRDEPENVLALETRGLLAFRQGNHDEARKWYEQSVKLDSQNFLAHYYFAAIAMKNGAGDPQDRNRIEASLRTAIKLNPAFAPAYERLAVFYVARNQNLDEATQLIQNAVQLDPGNVDFRRNAANVLLQRNRFSEAIPMLESALKLATTPEQTASIESTLKSARQYQAARSQQQQQKRQFARSASKPGEKPDTNSRYTPPHPIHTEEPVFPEKAREAHRQGICVVRVIVGTDGVPRDAKVVQALGMGLDEEALKAVRRWRFEPARRYGTPVLAPFFVSLKFEFFGGDNRIQELSDKAKSGDATAEFELATAFFQGRGIPKDETQGRALLERAAKQGLPQAQFQMGERLYEHGKNPAAYVDAYVWYTLAQRGGWKPSEAMVSEISTRLSPDQRAEADTRLQNWTVTKP